MRKVFDPETKRRVHWKVLCRRRVRVVGEFVKMQLEEELKGFIDRQVRFNQSTQSMLLKFVHNVPIQRIYFNCTITPEGVKIEE